jgi:hypothetical protein
MVTLQVGVVGVYEAIMALRGRRVNTARVK